VCFGVDICVGGNDDGNAGNGVYDDGNINLGVGLGIREGIGLSCVEWDADCGEVVMQ